MSVNCGIKLRSIGSQAIKAQYDKIGIAMAEIWNFSHREVNKIWMLLFDFLNNRNVKINISFR